MRSEVELYFGGDDPHMTITPIEAACGTELMQMAHAMAREQKAIHLSFGPVVERGQDGLPLYGKQK